MPDTPPSSPRPSTTAPPREVDVAIVGGGIAGLWLCALLSRRGYACVLLEADALGGAQTLASQGMIHGGLKYALAGSLTGASEAIARMPGRWRKCLAGDGEIDLSGLTLLSECYYLFAADSTLGKLTTFFASRSLRGRIEHLDRRRFPPALADPGFRGVVYAVDDFVLDTRQLVTALQTLCAGRTYRHELRAGAAEVVDDGVLLHLDGTRLLARRLVLCAGAGTRALLDGLGLDSPRMQLRPLHQVLVRHDYPHPLYAHCLTGIRRGEPRITITSHKAGDGWLWYLGGQLASDGVAMAPDALVRHARRELEVCLPWIGWQGAEYSTLRVDRAEPAQDTGHRPDEAFTEAQGPAVVAWPTKLSLVPDLGDRVLALLPPPAVRTAPPLDLPPAVVGRPPWEAA